MLWYFIMQRFGLLFAIGLMALIINIDYTAVNLALAPVARDFHLGVHDVNWLLSGYILAWAALVIPAGRAVDIYGPRKLCLLGLALFLVSSLLAGYAVNETMLVIGRVLQGIAGGLYVPALYGLISAYFPIEKRGSAMGILSLGAGLGLGFGPTFGGVIIHLLDWRWIFFVNVPIALVAIFVLWFTPEKSKTTDSHNAIPKLASVFLSLAVVSVTFALDRVMQQGVHSSVFIGALLCALLMFVGFVYRQKHSLTPLIAWRLFKNKRYVGKVHEISRTTCH
jgi:MFS family permease